MCSTANFFLENSKRPHRRDRARGFFFGTRRQPLETDNVHGDCRHNRIRNFGVQNTRAVVAACPIEKRTKKSWPRNARNAQTYTVKNDRSATCKINRSPSAEYRDVQDTRYYNKLRTRRGRTRSAASVRGGWRAVGGSFWLVRRVTESDRNIVITTCFWPKTSRSTRTVCSAVAFYLLAFCTVHDLSTTPVFSGNDLFVKHGRFFGNISV